MKKNFYENPYPPEWVQAIEALERDPVHQHEQAQRRASLDFLRDHFTTLRQGHLNRWVALLEGRVIVEGDSLDEVITELGRRDFSLGSVATQFVYPEGTEFIL